MQPTPEKYVLRRSSARRESFRIDYRGELNAAQYEAVVNSEGPFLVVAGAGTGKTRTLVYRVARLIESGIEPTSILLLTFTRKAAGEMLRRASLLLDGRCDRVAGGTFHSFANTTLRRFGRNVGLESNFTILDRGDAEDVLNLLRADRGLDRKERRFPRKQTIGDIISAGINRNTPLGALLESDYPHLLDHEEDLLALASAYATYKQDRQLVDYDDLLLKLRQLLAENQATRQHLSSVHRYMMVDEYQDTNLLQADIVRLLASEHQNIMAVGDDAQSIYSFRGANFRNIMDFPNLFPGTRIIVLEENYRSTQPVLDVTNAIIAGARERHTKHLFSKRSDGPSPLVIPTPTEALQSRFVCQRILELREEGTPLSDIAVLFRSSFHAFDLELELTRYELPFVKRGGFKFIETAHVKDALAHLRVINNPQDTVSWLRILLLLDGVGPRASEEIMRWIKSGPDVAQRLEAFPRRRFTLALQALAGLLRRVHQQREPEAQLEEILRYYEPLLKQAHADDYPKRRKDLDQLLTIAARYHTLEALLVDMALEPPTDSVGEVLATSPDEGLLTLSTIHSAKGLEWQAVFIIWAAEGRFPSTYSMRDDDIEEERRLMYVAATRAKRELYVSYPIHIFERGVGLVMGKPSRFIESLAPELLRPLTIVEESDDWTG
ncbi:MAG: ATP-dependent helicase [Deltaproteobacteria bacterium]|nr:ATP-dependent helicase [Deltaproteobacteria bacterium]